MCFTRAEVADYRITLIPRKKRSNKKLYPFQPEARLIPKTIAFPAPLPQQKPLHYIYRKKKDRAAGQKPIGQ